ncbi:unnamed protein product [Parajaminaea phylloscopi]
MPLSHPFAECDPLASVYYRRRDIYSLAWGHSDLSPFVLAAAPDGGYIALTRDPHQLVALGKASVLKPKILVYTAAGQLVESIPWDSSNRIAGIGFTSSEQLVVVLDEGIVRIYTLLSPCPPTSSTTTSSADPGTELAPESLPIAATATSYYIQRSLGQEATETGVVEARIWSGGLVALTGSGRFVDMRISRPADAASPGIQEDNHEGLWPVERTDSHSAQLLPHFLSSAAVASALGPQLPSSWTFIPPYAASSGLLEVLLSPPSPPESRPPRSGPPGSGSSTPASTQKAYEPGTVMSLDSVSGCNDMRLTRGPFSSISASPNGKLLALLVTNEKKLWVVSADFQRSLSEFDVTTCDAYQEADRVRRAGHEHGNGHGPGIDAALGGIASTGIRQIAWCGNNTVALAFDCQVVMVGPFGESLQYEYNTSVRLVSEPDGVRIIGAQRHEFVQKVADSTVAVFRPASSDPAALLFDASDSFSQRSPAKADESLRTIRAQLPQAVDTCIDAASHEWEVIWQRRLLKAAALGKSFLDGAYDSSRFVQVSRLLRVLNNVRSYEVGCPISFEEFQAEGAAALVGRLTRRNHHLLALRIAEHLRLKPDSILQHWARAKIARAKPSIAATGGANKGSGAGQEDEDLCALIVRKFESQSGGFGAVSYASIASSAFAAGRIGLATRLLDNEPRAVDQVPLLLRMGEDRRALEKSVESGDTDLVYHVLMRLKSRLSRGDFFRVVQAPFADAHDDPRHTNAAHYQGAVHQHLALRLLEVYARVSDPELLKDLFFTEDRRVDAALLAIDEAHREALRASTAAAGDSDASMSALKAEIQKLKDAQRLLSEDREKALESKLVDESVKLLSLQSALEREDGGRSQWLHLSLNDTLRELCVKRWHKKAEKLRSDFKIPDKRFASVKVDAYVKTRDWEGLWTFATMKKTGPPCGYEPILVKLLAAGQNAEALRYIDRSLASGDKADKAKLTTLLQRLSPAVAAPLQARIDERA